MFGICYCFVNHTHIYMYVCIYQSVCGQYNRDSKGVKKIINYFSIYINYWSFITINWISFNHCSLFHLFRIEETDINDLDVSFFTKPLQNYLFHTSHITIQYLQYAEKYLHLFVKVIFSSSIICVIFIFRYAKDGVSH